MPKSTLLLLAIFLGILAGGIILYSKRPPSEIPASLDSERRFGSKALNSFMPGHYKEFRDGLEQGYPIPENYETYYKIATKFLPDDFASHYMLALYCHNHGQWENAIQAYEKSMELNPGFFWTYYNLGCLYWQNGKEDAAIELWSQAVNIPPPMSLKSIFSSKLLTDCLGDLSLTKEDAYVSLLKKQAQLKQSLTDKGALANARPMLF